MHKKFNLIIYVCLLKSKDHEDRNVAVVYVSYLSQVTLFWLHGYFFFFYFFSPQLNFSFRFYILSVFWVLGMLFPSSFSFLSLLCVQALL